MEATCSDSKLISNLNPRTMFAVGWGVCSFSFCVLVHAHPSRHVVLQSWLGSKHGICCRQEPKLNSGSFLGERESIQTGFICTFLGKEWYIELEHFLVFTFVNYDLLHGLVLIWWFDFLLILEVSGNLLVSEGSSSSHPLNMHIRFLFFRFTKMFTTNNTQSMPSCWN